MKKNFLIFLIVLLAIENIILGGIVMKQREKTKLMKAFADIGFDHWEDCNLMNIEDGRLLEYVIAGICLANQEPWEVNERYHQTYKLNGVDQPEPGPDFK